MSTLRCFVKRRPSGRYVAVCLRPFLVTEGPNADMAKHRLLELIPAYLEDAMTDGDIKQVMTRRAPFSYYAEYFTCWFIHGS